MIGAHIIIVLVRYGLVVLFFPASALDKILNFSGAVKQAKQVFSSNAIAVALIYIGLFIELVMPLCIVSGIADRLAAFVLAGYCALTAVLFKRFWEPGDFWASGESKGRDLFWDFLKNFS
ncbi:MAG TPA: DoxX family membrane protein, partial [Acetobacteraceae bacterium]|nr:DoxX family membrane protein [Acetobacteraceae bacterium]